MQGGVDPSASYCGALHAGGNHAHLLTMNVQSGCHVTWRARSSMLLTRRRAPRTSGADAARRLCIRMPSPVCQWRHYVGDMLGREKVCITP
jgi:hypothetical protein